MTNLGGYQIPIIQSRPPSLSTPNSIFLQNPQTLDEGIPYALVNTQAGNLTFKIGLYPDLDLVYDSRFSLFMGDEVIRLHKYEKTAVLRTYGGYELAYERDKNPGSENADGQRYIRVADGPDDYGDMWVKDGRIKITRRMAGYRLYIEDKRAKETGTEKFFVLQEIYGPQATTKYGFDDTGRTTEILPEQGPAIAFSYSGDEVRIGLYGEAPGYLLTLNGAGDPVTLTMNMRIPGAHASEPIHTIDYALTYYFTYGISGQLTHVTDSIGRTHLTAVYQPDGKVHTLALPGQVWTYTYSGETTTIQFSGEGDLRSIQPVSTQSISYQLLPTHNTLVTETDPLGYTEIKTYSPARDLIQYQDKNENIWTYAYNFQHKMTQANDPLGGIWHWTYNMNGYRIYQKDPRNAETWYTYDSGDRLIQVRNALNYSTFYTYDLWKNVATIKDPGNHITHFQYVYDTSPTPAGQQRKILAKITTDPEGYTSREDYAYDELTGTKLTVKRTRPNGGEWNYTYQHSDGEVRAMETTDPFGNILSGSYDPAPCSGTYLVQYAYRRDARCDDCGDANDHRFWMGKDFGTGLTLKTRDQDHYEVHYAYENINGKWYLKEFQRFDLANDAWTTLGCGLTAPNWTRPSPEGSVSVTQYEYSARGDLMKETDPLGRETFYTYDGNGNMLTKTFPNGRCNTYHYDALNRLTTIDYPDASHDFFGYDAVGNMFTSTGRDAALDYTYDLLSRIATAVQIYDTREDTITYLYDGDNLRTQMTYSGRIWTYWYDGNHRTIQITNPYAETTQFTYATCCTAVQDVIHANGAKIHYDYDQAERITDVLNLKPDQSILKSFHYERDTNGFVTNVERENPYWNQAYLYDNRLQLEGASYGLPAWMNEVFVYDGRGNRMEKWQNGLLKESYGYNIADEIQFRDLLDGGMEDYAYSYTDNDQALMTFTMDFLWQSGTEKWTKNEVQTFDFREKMVKFHRFNEEDLVVYRKETTDVDYSYLPDGLGRVGKKAALTTTMERDPNTQEEHTTFTNKDSFFLNDFYNMLDEEITTTVQYDAQPPTTDFTQKVYTMGPGIDFPIAMRKETSSYIYYLNGHGDASSFLSTDEIHEESYEYNVWGTNELGNYINDLLYTSHMYDVDTNLLFNRNRYYNQNFGRFTQKDSILTSNSYNFAYNNPINYKDSNGLYAFQIARPFIFMDCFGDCAGDCWIQCLCPMPVYCEICLLACFIGCGIGC